MDDTDTAFQFIAFEFGSQLTRVDVSAFFHFSELRSICIPSSVETILKRAFVECKKLSLFSFERGSKLGYNVGRAMITNGSEHSSVRVMKLARLKTVFFNSGQKQKRIVCCPSRLKPFFHIRGPR
jgi:hypothetical protein